MRRGPPSVEERERRARILKALPGAARTALRLGAGNTVGLTRDDLRVVAEDAILLADTKFDPTRGAELGTFAHPFVRRAVLRALRARMRILRHELPADLARAERRAWDRRILDDVGAGIDEDDYDIWEQTEEDFAKAAQDCADDGMLALIIGRAARSPERLAIAREMRERLDGALAELPPVEARLFRMRVHEQQTLEEIGEAMKMKTSTLHEHLARVTRELRRRMAREG